MSKKELLLEKIEVKNFAGIDDSKPVLIYLGDKDNQKILTAEGDQEVGKTSWLTAIKGLLGASLELKEENYVNNKTKKMPIRRLIYWPARERANISHQRAS